MHVARRVGALQRKPSMLACRPCGWPARKALCTARRVCWPSTVLCRKPGMLATEQHNRHTAPHAPHGGLHARSATPVSRACLRCGRPAPQPHCTAHPACWATRQVCRACRPGMPTLRMASNTGTLHHASSVLGYTPCVPHPQAGQGMPALRTTSTTGTLHSTPAACCTTSRACRPARRLCYAPNPSDDQHNGHSTLHPGHAGHAGHRTAPQAHCTAHPACWATR